jgi:hypothetical protein
VVLRDIRDIFEGRGVDRLASKAIVDHLNGADDAMWPEWRGIHGNQQPRKRCHNCPNWSARRARR